MLSLRMLSLCSVALALVACDASRTTSPGNPPPENPPPVNPPPAMGLGYWTMHTVNGQSLPVTIAERVVEGVVERVVLDSAQIEVRDGALFEQHLWSRTVRGGAVVYHDTWVDAGRWSVDRDRYVFRPFGGGRTLEVRNDQPGRLMVREPLPQTGNPTPTTVEYRPRVQAPPPPPPATMMFRATALDGKPLPAQAYYFADTPLPPNGTLYELDSAVVILRPDGSYTKTVASSEWQSPNVEFSFGWTRMRRMTDRDFGTWERQGATLVLRSAWMQNRVETGTFGSDGTLTLRFGLAWGEALLNVSFDLVR